MIHVPARVYADVNAQKPMDFFRCDNVEVDWQELDQSDYDIGAKLGAGTFSRVYEAIDLKNNEKCAFKRLKPIAEKWLFNREIKVLKYLRNGPNIISFRGVVKETLPHTPGTLIFEHINGKNLKHILTDQELNHDDIRIYSYELLKALDFCHSMGVMHRDVKLTNVIIDRQNNKLKLIDFGLADFYRPGYEYPVVIGSRYYRAPELHLNYPFYDYSKDMWAFACMFGAMIFKRRPLFGGETIMDILNSIVNVLGSRELREYAEKYAIELDSNVEDLLKDHPQEVKKFFVNSEDSEVQQEALDLLNELLNYDHYNRMTAREAMAHSYFSSFARN